MDIEEIDRICDLYEEQLKSIPQLRPGEFCQQQQIVQDAKLLVELERLANEYQTRLEIQTTKDVSSPVTSGESIGPYSLLQQIGEGGMGVVFMAEQKTPVQRKVALKVIKPGMGSKEVIARFESERQALAMMDHENIARMFDAGTTADDRPYFVMELVRGLPLTKYCDENRLSIKKRLELFVMVCEAVQHAHQKGIIHRDIKPSNVLVSSYDGRPVPKVIDFGVAKAMHQKLTEKTLFTEFGKVIGTLQYMSPEQAGLSHLDIDTRSDIYSLGVLLYELLTGSPPIEKARLREAGWEKVMQLIREEEPRKPSTRISESGDAIAGISGARHTSPVSLLSLVRGDLDWVVMKALEKERSRRYETANGLGMDIQRYLNAQPVIAAPPSARYRVSKFVKRNRSAILVAMTIAVLLIMATGISTWQAIRATSAEKRALDKEAATSEINKFFLEDILQQSNPEFQPDRDLLLSTVLEQAVEKIGERFAEQPEIEANIRYTIGRSLAGLGRYDAAQPQLERVLELSKLVWRDDHPNTRSAMNNLAIVYLRREQFDKAILLLEKVLQLDRRLSPEKSEEMLLRMVNLADLYRIRGQGEDYQRSKALLDEALAEYRSMPEPPVDGSLGAILNLAVLHAVSEEYEEAEQMFREAVQKLTKIASPNHPMTLLARQNLAVSYLEQDKFESAESELLEVLELRKELQTAEHPDVAEALADLCRLYMRQKKYADAEPIARECLEICGKHDTLGDSWKKYHVQSMLGGALAGQGKPEGVEKLLLRGFEGMEQRIEKMARYERRRLAEAAQRLTEFYAAQDDEQETIRWQAKMHAIQKENGFSLRQD